MPDPSGPRPPQRPDSLLYTDSDRYGAAPASVLVDAVHNSVRDLVRRRFAQTNGDWAEFVLKSSDTLIQVADIEAIEQRILDTGYRFQWSSMFSQRDRPGIYQPVEGASAEAFSFEHPEAVTAPADADGREQRGVGDNVVRRAQNARGIARYIRTADQVLRMMSEGVPPDRIAIIDASGGTLTAPILERFAGVICAGGTVRSHLGILTREYGIPCLMNVKISGIHEGDRVEIESTAAARSAESYQGTAGATETLAKIWRLA